MFGTDDELFENGDFGWMEESSGPSGYIKGVVWNDVNEDGVVELDADFPPLVTSP